MESTWQDRTCLKRCWRLSSRASTCHRRPVRRRQSGATCAQCGGNQHDPQEEVSHSWSFRRRMFEGARTTEPPAILRHNAEAYAELRPSFRLQPCAAIHRSWHLSLLADDPPTGPGPGRRSACSCGVVWRHAQTYPAAHGDAVRRGARGARQSHRGEVCAGPYGVSGMKIWSRRTHKGQGQHLSIRHHHPDGAYPDQHRQRLWNMTTAKPPSFFRRTPEEDGRGGGFHTGATGSESGLSLRAQPAVARSGTQRWNTRAWKSI